MVPPVLLSCGILVFNTDHELLLCHVTGQGHWDLPKGQRDEGESSIDAALRETREETGLVLQHADLFDLGRYPFGDRRALHLYATRMVRFDTRRLHCASHFSHAWNGQQLPEMDNYGWFALNRAPALCNPKMRRVLERELDLPTIEGLDLPRANLRLTARPT